MDIRRNHSLDGLNTLGLPSRAERYAEAVDETSLLELLAYAEARSLEPFILGGGSNVVLRGDVPGLVIRLLGRAVTLESPDADDKVRVTVEAGLEWSELVERSLRSGLSGLENLSLIPGTVGAAPVQNIGAYGVELRESLSGLRAWHRPTRCWVELDTSACEFGYRDSRFKRERGDWVITSVTFELGHRTAVRTDYPSLAEELDRRGISEPDPIEVARAVTAIRRRKLPDPLVIGNAGSFFQNPVVSASQAAALTTRFPDMVSYPRPDGTVKLAAGWMIERLGYRGFRQDGVGVHEEQALVLVHEGGANGETLLALADRIIGAVEERYGVRLRIEPVVV